MMQQQTVVTSTGPIQPVYFTQPYQTTSVISSYRHGQSTLSGALLIVAGTLSIIFSIVEMAVISAQLSFGNYIFGILNGIMCGVMVSNLLCRYTLQYSKDTLWSNLSRVACLPRGTYVLLALISFFLMIR